VVSHISRKTSEMWATRHWCHHSKLPGNVRSASKPESGMSSWKIVDQRVKDDATGWSNFFGQDEKLLREFPTEMRADGEKEWAIPRWKNKARRF
jgi:hypothetical protein